jgi:predicted Fe-Mo cluster-binding NifX family protein
MKVAFTAWEDRISPVFDSAHMLMIADIENEQVIGTQYEPFNPQSVSRLIDMLKALEIEVLICGAISRTPSIVIEASGVTLISFVGGKIDDILKSYANGISIVPGFSMPGCGQQHQRKRRRHNAFLKENEAHSSYFGNSKHNIPGPKDTACCGSAPGEASGCAGPGSCCGKHF